MTTQVSPVLVGRALESLRNSDFDTFSAIGEVVDNSLEAKAKKINIRFGTEPQKGKRKPVVTEFSFGDDGHGMYKETLHRCLQLGYSTSYNDRNGIGRFAVGMTLGAIAQCRRVEVFSRAKGGEWNFTYIDLDEFVNQDNPIIPEPKQKEIPREYLELVGEPGTLVIWKKLDRVSDDLDDLEHWIGRTYRKFIAKKIVVDRIISNPNRVTFNINGKIVTAYDPLYVIKNDNFPQDETARFISQTIDFRLPDVDPPTRSSGSSKIIITMSLLPEKWRAQRGSGGSRENAARKVDRDHQGISILRNGREVFYGEIQYFGLEEGFTDLDRFWGCEISFNAEIDHWFSVKNIKVGAKPRSELRKALAEAIIPTILDYRKEIRRVWDKYDTKKNMSSGGALSGNEEAESVLEKILPKSKTLTEKGNETIITSLMKEAALSRKVTEALRQKLEEQPCVMVNNDQAHPRGPFMDITSLLDKTVIEFNMNHPFFVYTCQLVNKIKQLDSKKKPVDNEITLLTDSGLCAGLNANFEGAVLINKISNEDRLYFAQIQRNARHVNEELYESLLSWYNQQEKKITMTGEFDSIVPPIETDAFLISSLPMTRDVETLEEAYSNISQGLPASSDTEIRDCVFHDLANYKISPGLSKTEFRNKLKSSFFSHPFIQRMEQMINSEVYFGGIKEWIQKNCTDVPVPSRRELTGNVQVLLKWFEALGDGKYLVDVPGSHSQRLRKIINDDSL